MSQNIDGSKIEIENKNLFEKFDDFIKSEDFKNIIRNILNEFRIFNKRKIERALSIFLERNKN
jgi:hypothetical protein